MLYKITLADGSPCHGGSGKWSRPRGSRPGTWRTETGPIVPCRSGLHLCRVEDLPRWVVLDAIVWMAETDGKIVTESDKIVVGRARLVSRVGVLSRDVLVRWAADCAEHVLHHYEAAYPGDDRLRRAIEAARSGDRVAARAADAAAWVAARAVARAAAWDAAAAECKWQGERLIQILTETA